MMEHFSAALAPLHQRFACDKRAYRSRFDTLHNALVRVRELEDPIQQQKVFQQQREHYQHVREELHAAQELLREQQETYRQLRLNYQDAREQLFAGKAVIEQRQKVPR